MAEKMTKEELQQEAEFVRIHAEQMDRVPGPSARYIARELRKQASDLEWAAISAEPRRALDEASHDR